MRFPFVTQVMWATRAPQSHRGNVLVVIAIDGTRSHNRSFLHFSVGDVRSSLPYGSWVFVHGPEKKSVLQRLSAVAELNDEIKDVQQTTYIDSIYNGFECSVGFEIIADGKGHVALSACKGWTTAHPLAVVCWLCGRSHEVCVNQFGSGHVRIKDEWEHIGVVLSAVKPKQRPPEYGLHGAHRMVCCGCTGLYNALRDQHAFTEKRASEWVQFYLDPIRIQARTVTAQVVAGEDREGLHIEQTAAGEWIKAQGWECIADELQNSNLLQHDIVHNGVRVPWGEGFRQWGVLLGRTANLVWETGFLTATKVNELRADLKVMGALHRALGLSISLWPHLWVDHMVEVAGLYGDLSLTAGFKAEGRHKALKQEVRNRSFKGGGKGSRLRGVRKSWGELIRNDNMDYSLLNKGLNVWEPAWTKQEAYLKNKSAWKHLKGVQK